MPPSPPAPPMMPAADRDWWAVATPLIAVGLSVACCSCALCSCFIANHNENKSTDAGGELRVFMLCVFPLAIATLGLLVSLVVLGVIATAAAADTSHATAMAALEAASGEDVGEDAGLAMLTCGGAALGVWGFSLLCLTCIVRGGSEDMSLAGRAQNGLARVRNCVYWLACLPQLALRRRNAREQQGRLEEMPSNNHAQVEKRLSQCAEYSDDFVDNAQRGQHGGGSDGTNVVELNHVVTRAL